MTDCMNDATSHLSRNKVEAHAMTSSCSKFFCFHQWQKKEADEGQKVCCKTMALAMSLFKNIFLYLFCSLNVSVHGENMHSNVP